MNHIETQLDLISRQILDLADKADVAAEAREKTDDRLGHIEDRLAEVEAATSYSLLEWISTHWKIVAVIALPVPFVFTAFMLGVWQMKGPEIINFLREELRASQENSSILYQPPGLSFIRSPVEEGGKATYILVAKRTPVGLSCAYLDTTPIFTDELGRSLAGKFESRGRQYGEDMTRTELELEIPKGLLQGRVTAELQITYDCNGVIITHRTYPLAFQLLPKTHTVKE